MADEIELKLVISEADAGVLEASALTPARAARTSLCSVYFDTPDQALRKTGLSLRLRNSDGGQVQTVKANGGAGLLTRGEWEREVEGEEPVPDERTPVAAVVAKADGELAPAFAVHVERRSWTVKSRGAEIEAALDRGEVAAGDRRSPFCEVELELKAGDPAGLFALARRIDAVAPVRIGVLSKAERGYLLLGPAAPVVKAEPVRLSPGMSAAAAFPVIVQGCLRHYRRNEALLLERPTPETVHQARVALRRLRSAFSIYREALAGAEAEKLKGRLRALAAELGEARNLDVLIHRAERRPGRERLEAARKAAYARVGEGLASKKTRGLMLELVEWVESGRWLAGPDAGALKAEPVEAFAARRLEHYRRKVKKSGRDLAGIDREARHEVRKDAKKLRYAAGFFASLFEDGRSRRRYDDFIEALEELQDRLGALNDLTAMPKTLTDAGLAHDPELRSLAAEEEEAELLDAAVAAYGDWAAAKRFWARTAG